MKGGVVSNCHLSVIAMKLVHTQFSLGSKFVMNICHPGLLLLGDVYTSKKNRVITASGEKIVAKLCHLCTVTGLVVRC